MMPIGTRAGDEGMSIDHSKTISNDSLGDLCRREGFSQNSLPISDFAWKKLIRFGELIPLSITQFWGFEMSLSNDLYEADLLFCVHKADQFNRFVNGEGGLLLFGDTISKQYQWLGSKWSDKSDEMHSSISNLWFEYDYSDLVTVGHKPNFFFAPNPNKHILEILSSAEIVFSHLSRMAPILEGYGQLLKCHEALSGKAWISQIGVMLARSYSSIRVFIQDIPKNEIVIILNKLNYANASDPILIKYLAICELYSSQVNLNVDVDHKIGDKLGIECYFNTMKSAIDFMHKLCDINLCTSLKFSAIKEYMTLINFDKSMNYQSFFSHFKLVFQPGVLPYVKVYTGFVHNEIARKVIRTKPLQKLNHE